MDQKSLPDSINEITDSIINTPISQNGFEKIKKIKSINSSENNIENNDHLLKTKNPYFFFKKQDLVLLIPALIFNSLTTVTDVASTIMINEMFTKLTNFQSGEVNTNPNDFINDIKWPCFGLILIGLGTSLFGWLETFFFTYLGEIQQVRFRKHLLISLFSRNLNYFESNSNLDGDLIQLNRSIEEFRSSVSEYLSILCKSLFSIICLIIISMYYSWKLTLLMMTVFPLTFITIKFFGNKISKWSKEEDDQTSNSISLLDWNFSCFVWIKIIFSKDLEFNSFKNLLNKCEYSFKQFSIYANIVSSIMKTLSLMLFVQSFWFGSYLVKTNQNSSGDIISSFYSCLKLAMTISNLSLLAVIYQKAITSFQKILNFSLSFDAIEQFNKPLFKPNENLNGDIKFENVSFSYSNDDMDNKNLKLNETKILDSISLNVQPSKTTFIIGRSGSGKSTIANLLLKLYNPMDGSISIDGYDLKTLDSFWLRNQITLVQQFPKVFNDTIENNILLGTSFNNINIPEVTEAIRFFNFDKVVDELPNGYKTYIGKADNINDNLIQLSGGQEQKLNLVKAILRDSNILILDESMSALDIKQREEFMHKIRIWRKNKTTIIITHELTQISDNDMVFFIENGKIVESGLKSCLSVNGGKFSTLENLNFSQNTNSTGMEDEKKSLFELEDLESLNDLEKLIGTKPQKPILKDNNKNNIRKPIIIAYKLLLSNLSFNYKLWYTFGLFTVVVVTILTPVFTYCFSHLIEGIIPETGKSLISTHEQIKWSMIATAIAIATGGISFISDSSLEFVSQRLSKNIQLNVFKIILNQSITFFEYSNANELSTLMMNDIRDLRRIFSTNLARLISGVTVSIVCIIWTLITGWKYALVGFSFFPLFGIFSFLGTTITQKTEFNYKDSLNKVEKIVYESRIGIKTIMCLNIQDYFIEKFDNDLKLVLYDGFKRSITMGFSINSVFLIVNIAQSIMFYYGFKLVAKGKYTLVQMMEIIMMIMMSVMFIAELLSSAPGLYRGLRVALKLDQLLKLEDIKGNSSLGYLTPNLHDLQTMECIKFQNVTFSYPLDSQNKILKELSMTIPKNQIVSIVGESGSGKSTIFSLILRLFPLDNNNNCNNQLFVDGYSIDTIKLSWLMSNIAVVTQKHYFFNGSIKENLLYSNPSRHSISDNEIMNLLDKLELTDMINDLENGLDSPLSISGNILVSGGQAQRLSIARALLRPASILLLDEFTSSLDSYCTKIVLELIQDLKKNNNITVICITHQKKVMQYSDLIFFIKNGKISEQGNFETLIEKNGDLFQMVKNTTVIN